MATSISRIAGLTLTMGDLGAASGAIAPSLSYCGAPVPVEISPAVGSSDAEIAAVPEGANLGLGCGNPVASAAMRAAGFFDVAVVASSTFPIDAVNPDATEAALLATGIPPEDLRAAVAAMASVKVSACRPAAR